MESKSSIKSFNSLIIYTVSYLFLLSSCSQPAYTPTTEQNRQFIQPEISFSNDSLNATITTDINFSKVDQLKILAEKPLSLNILFRIIQPDIHDSTISMLVASTKKDINSSITKRTLRQITKDRDGVNLYFELDTTYIFPWIRKQIKSYKNGHYIHSLFNINPDPPKFDQIIALKKLIMPIDNFDIPSKASRWPNAPRSYRSGTHRGIDFFSNWGTPVRSVADGIVIRSDLFYKEVAPDFRKEMLKRAALLKRTPSDIFNELLLGQAVIIDHGFELFKGYRVITIYAHLSSINSEISPGYKIKAGETFAQSGNTGTEPSTLGTRNESHLHWELILQNQGGEYYFGQNLDYDQLMIALNNLFDN